MKQRVATFVRMTAFRRGVLGTSRAWFGLWAALGVARFVRKRLNKPEVVERFELQPGQALLVTDTGIERRAFRP